MQPKRSPNEKDLAERTLRDCRKLMERATEKLLAEFEYRQDLSRVIAESKKTLGIPVRDHAREQELIEKYAEGDSRRERLLCLLFELSREVQEEE